MSTSQFFFSFAGGAVFGSVLTALWSSKIWPWINGTEASVTTKVDAAAQAAGQKAAAAATGAVKKAVTDMVTDIKKV